MKPAYRNVAHFAEIGRSRPWDAARVEKLCVATVLIIAGGVWLLALAAGLGWLQ
jgi:hypothetical protein